jgi:hypothetical protein
LWLTIDNHIGTLIASDGTTEEGIWQNGEYVGES